MSAKVYWNYHEGCWSLVDTATGLLLGHADDAILTDAEFHVNANGRDRVRETGVKNVHAWIRGDCVAREDVDRGPVMMVRYDPGVTDHFEATHIDEYTGWREVAAADVVWFRGKDVTAAGVQWGDDDA